MLQIAIVVFREVFEIALIVGILMAVTKNVPHRLKWIAGGMLLGILSSLALAFFTDQISESFQGVGQEFFNGLILTLAAGVISWTVIWMQKHARTLSGELKNLGNLVKEGSKPLYVLMIVVFLSVLREGAEIVLFTYSYYLAGTSLEQIILGLVSGITLGTAFGVMIYFGILKFFGRYFFPVTTWILVFLSAGIASQGVGFWVSGGLLPDLGNPIFDSSGILPQESPLGKFLNIFFGYIDHPYGLQLLVYLVVIGVLVTMLKMQKKR
jgi:high-affinity iron transporter